MTRLARASAALVLAIFSRTPGVYAGQSLTRRHSLAVRFRIRSLVRGSGAVGADSATGAQLVER